LERDPAYEQLLDHFQAAEFSQCQDLLAELEQRYPDHPILEGFTEELRLKLSAQNLAQSIKKEEHTYKRRATLKLSAFAVFGTLAMLAALFASLVFFLTRLAADPPEPVVLEDPVALQLAVLYSQAEGLLNVAQPSRAVPLVETIQDLRPDFPGLEDLVGRLNTLLRLEDQYEAALALLNEGKLAEALELFQGIEAEQPGLWDVRQQIAALDRSLTLAGYLDEGAAAYQSGDWAGVISAYGSALALDATLDDPQIKEHLLRAYFSQAIRILERDEVPIENLEAAEGFYFTALDLLPQVGANPGDFANLQETARDLLAEKFALAAARNSADVNQTATSLAQAVGFMRRAVNLLPAEEDLRQQLADTESYVLGYQYFISQNWAGAITSLEPLVESDPTYAAGNAAALLFEAYTAEGAQLAAAEEYEAALETLLRAEALAEADPANLARLFQVGVQIGDLRGKMEAYQDAVNYYQAALNAIQAAVRVQELPELLEGLGTATTFANRRFYPEALAAYQALLQIFDDVYLVNEFEVVSGGNLALFAHLHLSTLDLVLQFNELPREMVIAEGRTLQAPMLEN
jgi:tetratricopeptide (TPR) repeat protein